MEAIDLRQQLIAAVTPLFAKKGLHGVTVRELARAARSNVSMISYYFGGKFGLYEAVLREVFADMLEVAETARQPIAPQEKFLEYVYRCGICWHTAEGSEFVPRTASADKGLPECPRCLNNDDGSFTRKKIILSSPTGVPTRR